MTDFWSAVALALASAVCYGGGAVGQRRVAESLGGSVFRRDVLLALLRYRLWWAAVTLNGFGALLHLAALAYGNLNVVQPLGALTLVFALPWAAWLAVRRVTSREWRGAVLTVAALSVLLAVAAPTTPGHTLDNRSALLVTVGTLGTAVALTVLAASLGRLAWRSQVLAAAAGILFGIASALTKTLTEEYLAIGLAGLWHVAAPGVVVLGGAGVLLSQAAYRGVTVGAPLATMTLSNPIAAVVVGLGFMGEVYLGGLWGLAVAALAGAVAVRGVVLLTVTVSGPPARQPTPPVG